MERNLAVCIIISFFLGIIGTAICIYDKPVEKTISPTQVMQGFIKALKDNDYKTAWKHLSMASKKGFSVTSENENFKAIENKVEELKKDNTLKAQFETSVVKVEIVEGDRARVLIEFCREDGAEDIITEEITMVNEDGKWKLSL